METLRSQMDELFGSARAAQRAEAQERLDARTYMVRVIDDCGWSKFVTYLTQNTLTASKSKGQRFTSLQEAVRVRNYFTKQDHVKSAWIIYN